MMGTTPGESHQPRSFLSWPKANDVSDHQQQDKTNLLKTAIGAVDRISLLPHDLKQPPTFTTTTSSSSSSSSTQFENVPVTDNLPTAAPGGSSSSLTTAPPPPAAAYSPMSHTTAIYGQKDPQLISPRNNNAFLPHIRAHSQQHFISCPPNDFIIPNSNPTLIKSNKTVGSGGWYGPSTGSTYYQQPQQPYFFNSAGAEPMYNSFQPPSYDPTRIEFGAVNARDSSANILVMRLNQVVNLLPSRLNSQISRKQSCSNYISIVPCVGEGAEVAPFRELPGKYPISPDPYNPGCFMAQINSPVLRIQYCDQRSLFLKVYEEIDGRKDMLGLVSLADVPEVVLSNPMVTPEQVISRPDFSTVLPIFGLDRNIRGELQLNVLFDYCRANEFAWPHPNYRPSYNCSTNNSNRTTPLGQDRQTYRAEYGTAEDLSSPVHSQIGRRPPMARRRHFENVRGRNRGRGGGSENGGGFAATLRAFCMQLPDTMC